MEAASSEAKRSLDKRCLEAAHWAGWSSPRKPGVPFISIEQGRNQSKRLDKLLVNHSLAQRISDQDSFSQPTR